MQWPAWSRSLRACWTQLTAATTVAEAAALVKTALKSEGGDLLALAESLGETLWEALIALAMADLGLVAAPARGA